MAKCNSGCGCSSCGSNRNSTRVGALNSICRSNDCPFYTGPCPDAPCNGCGCDSAWSRFRSGCCNARITRDGCSSCGSCSSCNNCSGCCSVCGNNPCTCGSRSSRCGCDSCSSCDNCSTRSSRSGCCSVCGNNPCTCGSRSSRCGCDNCSSHASGISGYGVFSAGGPFDLRSGSAVQFRANHASTDCFSLSGDCIRIHQPGVYFAIATADIPGSCCTETTLALDLNGQLLVPPSLAVHGSGNYAAHTVFSAHSGDTLRLSCMGALSIAHSTDCPVFTLTLLRIE